MNIEQCKAEIKRHEGEVLEIYMDSLGYKTLGIGHLCQPNDPEYSWKVGTKVSQEVVNMYSDLEKTYFFHNAFSVFKKSDLEEYPFNEKIVGKEDRYWANDIIANKSKIFYDPNLEVDHHYTKNGNTWKVV